MGTKMKGLLKGLRYISQIFDEEKEQEMQIGFPTDVKHVAHIGWDGPSVDSPSWMNEFKGPGGYQSAPLGKPGDSKPEGPEIKWVSEDSKGSGRNAGRDSGEVPRSSRRHSSENPDSPKKESSSKRGSRRHSKESSDSVRSANRQSQDQGSSESPKGNVPDIPKKSRRKKSKEIVSGGGSTKSSRSGKGTGGTSSPYSDSGADSGSVGSSSVKDDLSQNSSMKLPNIAEEEQGSSGVS